MPGTVADKPVAEGRVAVINLSNRNRKFQCAGFLKDDGTPGDAIEILPNAGKSIEIPEKAAAFLLGKLSNGNPRYPELKDAASYVVPSANTKAKLDALTAENKKLIEENAALKGQLDAFNEKKGAKK
jgi:hypothetical protein